MDGQVPAPSDPVQIVDVYCGNDFAIGLTIEGCYVFDEKYGAQEFYPSFRALVKHRPYCAAAAEYFGEQVLRRTIQSLVSYLQRFRMCC